MKVSITIYSKKEDDEKKQPTWHAAAKIGPSTLTAQGLTKESARHNLMAKIHEYKVAHAEFLQEDIDV